MPDLRVFISSTFRDLQEEREHLVKKIFPEIRSLCRERGITFTEVDLRWGLTDEQLALGQVIRTCLEEIDKCRPYFIGITGERYGYVPELAEYYKDAELLAKYPWLQEAAMDGSSIIDLEFRHAALNSPEEIRASSGFFFRRSRYGVESDIDAREAAALAALQQRVRGAGMRTEEFRDPASLGEMIYDELRRIIDRDFATATPPTPLEEERSLHRAFAESRRHAYIPNADYLTDLNAWFLEANALPLVIYAESGSGKSSLVSFWCEQLRRRRVEVPVVEHYVGIGAGDADHLGIMRHVMEEIRELFGRSEEIPSKPEDIEREFANWMGFTVGRPLLLVIDGINQLTGRALDLHWLPPIMPEGVKLIITSTVERTLIDLRGRGWPTMGMQPLRENEREAVVVRYLSEYHKALSKEQVRRIAGDVKCAHPLFLRTLLEELRLDSSHEQLDTRIERYLRTTGTEDLFQQVLERMEDDYGTRAVREVMSLTWCSRRGFDETDLAELTGVGRLKLSTMLNGLDYHLVRKDGVLTFFHDYLRRAVEKRYLSDAQKQQTTHRKIAECFQKAVSAAIAQGASVPVRMAGELAYQLNAAGEHDRLHEILSTIPVFLALYAGQTQYEVLAYWSAVTDASVIDTYYRQGVERWEVPDGAVRSAGVGRVVDLLQGLGRWSTAIELCRDRLSLAVGRGDTAEEAASRGSLGWLLQLRGEYDEALGELARALDLFSQLGDRSGLASSQGNMGIVYRRRGEYDRALECFGAQLRIIEELGDRTGLARAQGNMGNVYLDRGEYDRALECYGVGLRIFEELGDRRGLAFAQGNMGIVYYSRGEYDRALECYEVPLRISEELGDLLGLANVQVGVGNVYFNLGEYDRALECYGVVLRISEELGDRSGLAAAQGNMGNVYSNRGEYDRALECYGVQLRISEELGDRSGLALARGNMGSVYYSRGEYDRALECYGVHLRISQELGDRRGLAAAQVGVGNVYFNLGEYDRALECFGVQLRISEELGDRSGLALARGNMGSVYSSRGEYERALDEYSQAAGGHRQIGYRYGLSYWLEGTARVLLELIEGGQEMPEYLAQFVPGAEPASWRVMTLRMAREQIEECVAISEELSKTDTLFLGRVLMARIDAAERNIDAAIEQLGAMLAEATDDDQHAELHYWLWKLGAPGHSPTALAMYEAFYARTPKHEYHKRIEELKASAELS